VTPTLFDAAPLQVRPDPLPTQTEAHQRNRVTDLERVRRVLLEHPAGLTDHEIADLLGEPNRKPSLGRRRAQLGAVKVEKSPGEWLTRKSHGVSCVVWRLEVPA
jgi:hypothetical protein